MGRRASAAAPAAVQPPNPPTHPFQPPPPFPPSPLNLIQIVAKTLDSPDCASLRQYAHLRAAIARSASSALDRMKEEARGMVLTLVDMERSYLTAEVFKEILAQSGRGGDVGGELVRTLSGRMASRGGVAGSSGVAGAGLGVWRAWAWSGCLVQGGPGMTAHPRPSHPCPPPSAAQVLKAKKQLLDDLQKDVASADDGGLRRWLSEDEATVRRREACAHRLRLLRQAADEVSAASL